ncbi:Chaperonin 60 subunit alpha 1, chloroplastic [Datura stramonium]|uniref:Chaperonin 60 subunit alpha 1, chloroplastic n=1 Tax=Datura stramonium TaxID=4076 RepID=A0ABS8VHJ7_DATST|nr:Chaperonin 60 subunit alpha 1, chloroplastic [Datura stramonium]
MASANAISTASILPSSSKQVGLKGRRVNQLQGQKINNRASKSRLVCCWVSSGSGGRNVVLDDYDTPKVVNDGVTIARAIELADAMENAGASLIREVASLTNDAAGDGTTTASVLAREIIKLGGLDLWSRDDIKAIASISAGNDDDIGSMIADTIGKVGPDGFNCNQLEIQGLEVVGSELTVWIEKGYISPQFITNQEKLIVEFENARVLVTDHEISAIKDIMPLLEKATQLRAPLLIIAGEVTGEALATLIRLKRYTECCRHQSTWFWSKEEGSSPRYCHCNRWLNLPDQIVLLEGDYHQGLSNAILADAVTKDEIQARISQIKKELDKADSVSDSEKLAERIAKLSGGVAVIKGIVPGGGAALVHLSSMSAIKDNLENPEKLGADIIQKALIAPASLIAQVLGLKG